MAPGLQRIDPSEKNECTEIRRSRSECGCTCAGGLCDPVTCECALNDIPCQVDRVAFPCACVAPAHCANPAGRTEFNLARVRTHYFHTRLRLDAETARERSSCGEVKKQRLLEGGTATNLVGTPSLSFYINAISNALPTVPFVCWNDGAIISGVAICFMQSATRFYWLMDWWWREIRKELFGVSFLHQLFCGTLNPVVL